jgi:hypothetical protein
MLRGKVEIAVNSIPNGGVGKNKTISCHNPLPDQINNVQPKDTNYWFYR